MGTWAFPTAFFLLCLTSESLQGGLPPLSPGLGKGLGSPNGYRSGYGPLGGLGAGFGNGNGLGTQPGIRAGVRAQKPASRSVSPGFGNGNGLAAGAFPGAVTQPGFGGGVQPQKPEYGNGLGMGAFPGLGAQPAFGNGNRMGVGAQPGLGAGVSPQKPGLATQNGYGAGFGVGTKPQKPGFGNGNGLGAQPGPVVPMGYRPVYRNGLGAGTFPGEGAQPGLGRGLSPPKPGYLPGPRLQLPAGYGNGNGLRAQSAPTPGISWGLKPQKAGSQLPNGYGVGTELGFGGGLKPQKVGFVYGNGLGAGVFLQPEFPGANGLRNGYGEEAPAYPKAAVPGPEGNGQAGALRSSSWPSVQPWGLAPKPGYGAGATYGQLRPELGPGPFGSPDAKRGSSGLGNGYGGP
eukprot:XP_022275915.1 glycine-rich cell wall structural protein-like isoform X35 [Canis lupus familiaris]